ncbi:MAG: peptidylprolyl isomerase [Myxococcota bacterium]|nr:peptidylprolyl isomerase [Myxococcota bacterium]
MLLLISMILTAEASTGPSLDAIWRAEITRQRPAAFAEWTTSNDPELRAAAARSLGRLRHADARELLERLLLDDSPEVRAAAAFGLGLTPGGSVSLLANQNEGHPDVLARIFDGIGLQAESEAIPWLIEGMTETEPVARAAAVAIGRIGMARKSSVDHPQIIKELVAALELDQMERRRAAAFALARIGPSDWPEDELSRATQLAETDYDPIVRSRLVRALTAERSGLSVVPLLTRVADDRAPEVRVAAAKAVGTLPKGHARVLGLQLLSDPNLHVQIAAAEALVELPDSALDDALLALKDQPIPALQRVGGARHAMVFDIEHNEDWPVDVFAGWLSRVEYPQERDGSHHRPFTFFATRSELSLIRTVAAGRLLQEEALPKWGRVLLREAEDPVVLSVGVELLGTRPTGRDWTLLTQLLGETTAPEVWTAVIEKVEKVLVERPRTRLPPSLIQMLQEGGVRPELQPALGILLDQIGQPAPPPVAVSPPLPSLEEILSYKVARVFTDVGELRIELYPEVAPRTVWNFVQLAESDAFDGLPFHRVVPDFVIQTGCPRGDGWGGPAWTIPDELTALPYVRGTVGMALSGPDTGGSQWFITLSDHPHLEGSYTVFGQIIGDMRVAQKVALGTPILDVVIESVGRAESSAETEASP